MGTTRITQDMIPTLVDHVTGTHSLQRMITGNIVGLTSIEWGVTTRNLKQEEASRYSAFS